ncbi:MFS transporter [Streptomyces cavernicola]|uniref:MFS transporter n=1 Tax=Streptomyces cavernicola TaxID=3043613 RepID=A0ABT6S781_9ACTN|nr:MFS transporter [Streptomyces sp. B-S-A6]MDI3403966.1 MFS transporter [Streptomyces sp. B-S-A6]
MLDRRTAETTDDTTRAASVWRAPGMPALLGSTALGFAGVSLLLPVAPLWVLDGGADELGAGVVNAVMMLCTVAAQLLVGRALQRIGWRRTLMLGAVLLGAPAPAHLLTDDVRVVTALAAVRGLGFGIITVCGATGVAALVEPARRGRAVGAYGLAIATPQFLLVPLAPWLAERVGYWLVFTAAVIPLLALALAPSVARALHAHDGPAADAARPAPAPPDRTHLRRALTGPIAALLVITSAGGAVLTFTPSLAPGPAVAVVALLVFTGASALCRWAFGGFADRRGAAPAIAPLLLLGAAGLAAIGTGTASDSDTATATLLVTGMLALGIAYGGLQNLTLVHAFAAAGEDARSAVGTAWNIGFDAGTGLGALAAGAVAASFSYTLAYAALAAVTALVGVSWIATARKAQIHHRGKDNSPHGQGR